VPIHRTRKRLLGADPTSRQGATNMPPRLRAHRAYVPRSPLCLARKGATHNTPARFERGCRRLVVDRSDCPTPRYCNLVPAAERRPLSRTAGPALAVITVQSPVLFSHPSLPARPSASCPRKFVVAWAGAASLAASIILSLSIW